MENNPKKSKALIITFIVVLLILIGGYFLLKNSEQVFGTKGATTINKIFSPLLGTSKKTTLETIDTSSNTNSPQGATSSTGEGTTTESTGQEGLSVGNFGTSGNMGSSELENSGKYSIPVPGNNSNINLTSSNLNINNGENFNADNNNSNNGDNTGTSDSTDTSVCAGQNALVFTDTEKESLKDLLRRYYKISSNVKTSSDIGTIESNMSQNQDTINQAIFLTNLCKEQKADLNYTGPKEVMNNPYYQSTVSQSYIPEYTKVETVFNIW